MTNARSRGIVVSRGGAGIHYFGVYILHVHSPLTTYRALYVPGGRHGDSRIARCCRALRSVENYGTQYLNRFWLVPIPSSSHNLPALIIRKASK